MALDHSCNGSSDPTLQQILISSLTEITSPNRNTAQLNLNYPEGEHREENKASDKKCVSQCKMSQYVCKTGTINQNNLTGMIWDWNHWSNPNKNNREEGGGNGHNQQVLYPPLGIGLIWDDPPNVGMASEGWIEYMHSVLFRCRQSKAFRLFQWLASDIDDRTGSVGSSWLRASWALTIMNCLSGPSRSISSSDCAVEAICLFKAE